MAKNASIVDQAYISCDTIYSLLSKETVCNSIFVMRTRCIRNNWFAMCQRRNVINSVIFSKQQYASIDSSNKNSNANDGKKVIVNMISVPLYGSKICSCSGFWYLLPLWNHSIKCSISSPKPMHQFFSWDNLNNFSYILCQIRKGSLTFQVIFYKCGF